jgi:hypothetical protein
MTTKQPEARVPVPAVTSVLEVQAAQKRALARELRNIADRLDKSANGMDRIVEQVKAV